MYLRLINTWRGAGIIDIAAGVNWNLDTQTGGQELNRGGLRRLAVVAVQTKFRWCVNKLNKWKN